MTSILTPNTFSRLCVTDAIYILGDDAVYHKFMLTLSGGIPVWTEVDNNGLAADDSFDISRGVIGTAFYMYCADDQMFHQFTLELQDPTLPLYLWTDYNQMASVSSSPPVYRTIRSARSDAGLYLKDSSGDQLHKMSVIGGFFAEEIQGYAFPL